MDQKKIGEFISTIRKEKGLTQKDLAEKLSVSVNAVSKWERGICLMDMSLLKPLSKILDISIIEIINGERDNNNTTSAIEKTINYSNQIIKKEKKKNKKIIILGILAIIILGIFGYKCFYVNLINNCNENYNYDDKFRKEYGAPVYISTKTADNYYEFKNIKFKNIFESAYVSNETIDEISYVLEDDKYVTIRSNDNILKLINDYKNINSLVDNEEYLNKLNIKTSLDVYKFLADYNKESVSIFSPLPKLKESFFKCYFYSLVDHSFDEVHELKGDLSGYVVILDNNFIEYHINTKDISYGISFVGKFDFNYTLDIINTLIIK